MLTTSDVRAPSPRWGGTDNTRSETPGTGPADDLRAAAARAGARLVPGASCAGDESCDRGGSVVVATAGETSVMCGLHALSAVFTASELIVLLKPRVP